MGEGSFTWELQSKRGNLTLYLCNRKQAPLLWKGYIRINLRAIPGQEAVCPNGHNADLFIQQVEHRNCA